jgi:thiol-disulfide isomerase/thioredoxin
MTTAEPDDPDAGVGPGPGAKGPGAIARFGLALVAPRFALALADQPAHAGRSGSDLIRLLGLLLVSVHTRRLVAAVWLAVAVGLMAGLRGVAAVLSEALTVDLAFLVVATLVLWLAAGPRRSLGRAFDQVCVAAIPLIAIEVIATAVVRGADLAMPRAGMLALSGVAYAWAGMLVALAWRQLRRAPPPHVPVPPAVVRRGRVVGAVMLAIAGVALVINTVWVVRNADLLRPMTPGDPAPAFALPAVAADGKLAAPVALDAHRGKLVVVDFWATWCQPCLDAMPELATIRARLGADGEVIAINLDDPVAARKLIDKLAPGLTLVFDDQGVASRYGVGPVPHSVVIDRAGRVLAVLRGDSAGLAAAVERARRE